ncbi:MAG: TrmH family RNA methyltransferase [Chitinophagales bacterium]|nr:TrmH family RNA methyltransferase [Chitinophagales bacterium]
MADRQLTFRDERPDKLADTIASIHENRHPVSILADQLDDPQNIGMLFRLADAARLSHLWFYNTEESILKNRKLKRVARSTLDYVPHSFLSSDELEILSNKTNLVALEVTEQSIPITTFTPPSPIVLVIGNESHGVSDEVLVYCQQSIHIPMYGINTSMNVAMASGIGVYSLLEKLL